MSLGQESWAGYATAVLRLGRRLSCCMQIAAPKKASPSEQDPDDMPSDSTRTTMLKWQLVVVRKYGGSMRVVFAFLEDTTQAGSLNRPEWSYACVSVLHASNLTNASS